MSQHCKLPLHKRWVTAKSFDALSHQGKPPERTEQTLEAESFFNLFFFDSLILPNNTNKKKTTSSFVTKTHHFYHHFLLLLLLFIPTRSLFSPCVGEKVLLPLGPALFNYQPHETTRFVRSSSRNANRVSILDFGNTLITNHHRKLEIFIRRRHAFTFARRRGGERGRRDRGTRRRRDRRK